VNGHVGSQRRWQDSVFAKAAIVSHPPLACSPEPAVFTVDINVVAAVLALVAHGGDHFLVKAPNRAELPVLSTP
jgi:hypothetical protein